MQDENALETKDVSRVRAWLEGVGGNIFIGEGKLKTVKISKRGNKLTLGVKKNRKKDKSSNEPATA